MNVIKLNSRPASHQIDRLWDHLVNDPIRHGTYMDTMPDDKHAFLEVPSQIFI